MNKNIVTVKIGETGQTLSAVQPPMTPSMLSTPSPCPFMRSTSTTSLTSANPFSSASQSDRYISHAPQFDKSIPQSSRSVSQFSRPGLRQPVSLYDQLQKHTGHVRQAVPQVFPQVVSADGTFIRVGLEDDDLYDSDPEIPSCDETMPVKITSADHPIESGMPEQVMLERTLSEEVRLIELACAQSSNNQVSDDVIAASLSALVDPSIIDPSMASLVKHIATEVDKLKARSDALVQMSITGIDPSTGRRVSKESFNAAIQMLLNELAHQSSYR
jgi:hypothetical protein